MCGAKIGTALTWAELYAKLWGPLLSAEIDPDAPDAQTGYNLRPTQQIQIAAMEGGALTLTTARWWFIPDWHRGSVKDWKQTTFNARIETAFEKPTFRKAWRDQHCIIPMRGYYEWTGEAGAKQPWYIQPETNMPVSFVAGLHSRFDDGLRTCTILTRPAVDQIKPIHSRMPVILTSDEIESWLYEDSDDQALCETLGAHWDNRLRAHKVKPFGIHDDGPALIEPFAPPEQLGFGF